MMADVFALRMRLNYNNNNTKSLIYLHDHKGITVLQKLLI